MRAEALGCARSRTALLGRVGVAAGLVLAALGTHASAQDAPGWMGRVEGHPASGFVHLVLTQMEPVPGGAGHATVRGSFAGGGAGALQLILSHRLHRPSGRVRDVAAWSRVAALVAPDALGAPHRRARGPAVAGVVLRAGVPVGVQLRRQGQSQGWTVLWHTARFYNRPVVAQAYFAGPFESAAQDVVRTLGRNARALMQDGLMRGIPSIRADIYEGNHVIVVRSSEKTHE